MNCSNTKVFFSEWTRMCMFFEDETKNCPLKECEQSCGYACYIGVIQDTEKAIKIVQEWSDQHPAKTRLSVLKEQYPNVKLSNQGKIPAICPTLLYGGSCPYSGGAIFVDCVKCWNTPIEDDNNA